MISQLFHFLVLIQKKIRSLFEFCTPFLLDGQIINDLIDAGQILEAIVEVLKALGYDMSNATIEYSSGDDSFLGSITSEVDGETVIMNVYLLPFLDAMLEMDHEGGLIQ